MNYLKRKLCNVTIKPTLFGNCEINSFRNVLYLKKIIIMRHRPYCIRCKQICFEFRTRMRLKELNTAKVKRSRIVIRTQFYQKTSVRVLVVLGQITLFVQKQIDFPKHIQTKLYTFIFFLINIYVYIFTQRSHHHYVRYIVYKHNIVILWRFFFFYQTYTQSKKCM